MYQVGLTRFRKLEILFFHFTIPFRYYHLTNQVNVCGVRRFVSKSLPKDVNTHHPSVVLSPGTWGVAGRYCHLCQPPQPEPSCRPSERSPGWCRERTLGWDRPEATEVQPSENQKQEEAIATVSGLTVTVGWFIYSFKHGLLNNNLTQDKIFIFGKYIQNIFGLCCHALLLQGSWG